MIDENKSSLNHPLSYFSGWLFFRVDLRGNEIARVVPWFIPSLLTVRLP